MKLSWSGCSQKFFQIEEFLGERLGIYPWLRDCSWPGAYLDLGVKIPPSTEIVVNLLGVF